MKETRGKNDNYSYNVGPLVIQRTHTLTLTDLGNLKEV